MLTFQDSKEHIDLLETVDRLILSMQRDRKEKKSRPSSAYLQLMESTLLSINLQMAKRIQLVKEMREWQ